MAAPVLQFRRGLLANLPALRAGEPGFATDSYDIFVGLTSQSGNNKFFGSARYWNKETSTVGSSVRVVEGTNNGANYIALKSPDSLAGDVTYTLPGTITAGNYLTVDGTGQLSWVNLTAAGAAFTGATLDNTLITGVTTISGSINSSANSTFSGITTFTNTTDNTLGDENTGAVQLDGGMGIAKNLTVKQNLHVGGYSEFVGVVTFKGGTINLGDANTDDINVAGEFISSLNPNADATYDIGDGANTKRWRHASFSGVGTFATGAVVDAIQIGITAASEIDTSSGDLTLDSATGTTNIDDNLVVTGDVRINGNDIQASDGNTNITLTSNTLTTFAGDIRVNGNDIQASDGNTNITMTSNTLTSVAGDLKVGGNDIQASDGNTNITMTSNTLTTLAGDLKINGNDIQSSAGNTVITLANDDATFASDVTVGGNLYVNGSTTQVNTTSLTVEDSLIELGFVDGVAPTSDLNKDLGLLFNYYTTSAKKAAVYWDDSTLRIVVASEVSESTGVLTPTTYADFEIGSLYVNDCAGSSKVITCTGSERLLENITIDGGAF